MPEIKNIIFDLGGVIYNIDYQLSIDAFLKLGIKDFRQRYSQASQTPLFDALETGKITPQEFYEGIRKESGLPLTQAKIDAAWNAMLINMPPHRMELLRCISENYQIYLLSNTNAIHIPLFNTQMDSEFGEGVFHALFRKVYLSYQVRMRKPNREIFDMVLQENQLLPEETFFIDDSSQHVEGAAKTGIRSFWLKPGLTIEHLFSEKGILKSN